MNLTVTSSPHIRGKDTTRGLMTDVVIALIPTLIAGVVVFGLRALAVAAVSMAAALAAEAVINLLLGRGVHLIAQLHQFFLGGGQPVGKLRLFPLHSGDHLLLLPALVKELPDPSGLLRDDGLIHCGRRSHRGGLRLSWPVPEKFQL